MTQFDSKLIAQAKKTKGYLLKKSNGLFSSWKKHYFIILQDSLSVFDDQTLQNIRKTIKFYDIDHIVSPNEANIQVKTKNKIYSLRAQNLENKELWVASLNILAEYYREKLKNPKRNNLNLPSKDKNLSSPNKNSQVSQKTKASSKSKKQFNSQKITYLLREKQLSKILTILNLDKLSAVTKQQKYLSRILFIQDRKNGIYFCLSSKSIYPVIDGELIRQDFIYPYQLNVLYFLPLHMCKVNLENKQKNVQFIQICKTSEILQCTAINDNQLKLQIHCQKNVEIQAKNLSQRYIEGLIQCIKKSIQIGKQYWNPKGKLLKNIDKFLQKFQQSDENELLFYKMVQQQFQTSLNLVSKSVQQKREIQIILSRFQNLTSNLKNFIEACQIKSFSINQIKQKFAKLYHKFVYNYLTQTWDSIYKEANDEQLILYSKKTYNYFQVLSLAHQDNRVKQGSRSLVKIVLKNFYNATQQLKTTFADVEQQSMRILKSMQLQDLKKQPQNVSIFFNTFCNNFLLIFSTQLKTLIQLPRNQQFSTLCWLNIKNNFKTSIQSLSQIAQNCKQKSSLISISNSLKMLKTRRLPQLTQQLQKCFLFSNRRQKEQFLKEANYEMQQVETFCVKKLFVITFTTIDKELLKHEIRWMDFGKICAIVVQEIGKFQYILPEVKVVMYESAFQEVCYFLYICVVKFQNKLLTKDECLNMINQKMMAIRQCFGRFVDDDKIMLLLKDLNLLKQFITCPNSCIKGVTRDLKKVFGSNFTQIHLKNLISLRVSNLKDKQNLFQQCRQQIKSSYNSSDQIESFQRESFFNSSYRQERKSTLTQSIQSYRQHFENGQPKTKIIQGTNRLFAFSSSIKQGYLYRKKVIRNFHTSYTKYYYRLKKGKFLEWDNEYSQDILNCYLLIQLRKCYLEPDKNNCIHLEFDKDVLKVKTATSEEAGIWIQKILEAMQQQKTSLGEINQVDTQDGALFQDLSKKKTLQTKQSNQILSPKSRNKRNNSPQQANNRSLQKKTLKFSSSLNKKAISPSKLTRPTNKAYMKKVQQPQKKKTERGCGTGCNFF